MKVSNAGSTAAGPGAAETIWLLIPVSASMSAGTGMAGSTRLENSAVIRPALRILTAAISVIRASAWSDQPVVSHVHHGELHLRQRPSVQGDTVQREGAVRGGPGGLAGAQIRHGFHGRAAHRHFAGTASPPGPAAERNHQARHQGGSPGPGTRPAGNVSGLS